MAGTAGQMVSFARNGEQTDGYLARPDGGGRHPGVIVVQEWWGLVPHIKDLADRLAGEGFVALAPDLYHGTAANEPDEAGKLMMALRLEEAAKDLDGAVRYLLAHEATGGQKAGIVGFCMGGGLALYEACHNAGAFGACVDFYGVFEGSDSQIERLQAPLLGIFAEHDQWTPPAQVQALKARLQALGKQAELHVYPGCDHAFFNDTSASAYKPEAAQDAWRRTLAFFREHLSA
ncbi:MAG TPA: dienelactone hydrolase family protein [Dehalococcoidia bacterium]|nr:dienelactone hydrolase family protein [Dehalococcoidia bacterium]